MLERTTVGGVPAWWAPAPGPVLGSLMFRTGRADETLATAGITHLVEHLALFALGRREHAYNGFVDDDRCVLYASGTRDEVATFLRDAAAALTALPVDRLPVERRLLRTEAAQRDEPGVVPRLLSHRYGAAGYGLSVYEEIGLRWLGPDEVAAWAAERFTLENAVLWLTAEPPPDLELPLPAGRRMPVPEPDPLPIAYPAAVHLPPGRLVPELAAEAFEALLEAGARGLDDEVRLELRALPGELGVGELPLALVAAQYGLIVGLLTITDGRFLWLCRRSDGLQRIAWRWASLAEVEARSVGELRVTPREGATESFTVKPMGRAREIADLIGGQIAAADA